MIGGMRTKNNPATGVQHALENISFDKVKFQHFKCFDDNAWLQSKKSVFALIPFSHSVFYLRNIQVNSVKDILTILT